MYFLSPLSCPNMYMTIHCPYLIVTSLGLIFKSLLFKQARCVVKSKQFQTSPKKWIELTYPTHAPIHFFSNLRHGQKTSSHIIILTTFNNVYTHNMYFFSVFNFLFKMALDQPTPFQMCFFKVWNCFNFATSPLA